jgi:hypothetical protein
MAQAGSQSASCATLQSLPRPPRAVATLDEKYEKENGRMYYSSVYSSNAR